MVDALLDLVKKHWGYETLRPLQREAMAAAIEKRDSLVIMPTGGGKSLCYQAPAMLSDRLTVVVSPLISLMKDQVDRLLSRGIPAAFVNSSLDASDKGRVQAGILRGEYRMIFVAPERFSAGGFSQLLAKARVGAFAIDEAHCISHWGHDFRQDYRGLGRLKREFPEASVHAFTATATPRVREDIVEQLGLKTPEVLVGDFFRPNLRYRVRKRTDAAGDILEELERRPGQAGIVYCIRRADVDELAVELEDAGIKAAPYHAGMDDDERTRTQDRFAAREVDVIAATVAFGMGIDRADIRFVFHAAMPKSIEHYQQETGRAGRDGKPADCTLFYSGQDFQVWRTIIENNETADLETKLAMLSHMYNFCTGARCRHRRLVEYFGQAWKSAACGACDVCLGEIGVLPDATVMAQKILSCIARTNQRYGPAYIAEVLRGEATDRVTERGHDTLSTFGLLADRPKPALISWMHQLLDQGALATEGEYGVLRITEQGRQVLRSESEAVLYVVEGAKKSRKKKKEPKPAHKPTTDYPPSRISGAGASAFADFGSATADKSAGQARLPTAGGRRPATGNQPPAAGNRRPAPGGKSGTPVDSSDEALFEELRDLRRQLADARRVPAFVIFSDKALRAMAHRRPTTPEEFLDTYGVGEAKLRQFGETFMAAIRAHTARR